VVGILVGSAFCLVLAVFDFSELIEMVNFLYIFAQMLEFAAFIKLRISAGNIHRPYKIPLSTRGCVCMLILPFLFMIIMICLASFKTWLVCALVVGLGEVCEERSENLHICAIGVFTEIIKWVGATDNLNIPLTNPFDRLCGSSLR
jgi:amino acid transporter